METPVDSTLFPKITNHIAEVINTLRWQERDLDNPEKQVILEPIPIIGTVKLHGTHADILVFANNDIVLQSRNKVNLRSTSDNHGFATAMEKKRATLLRLRDRFVARWKKLHPGEELDTSLPVTIAGEWIGEKIQKGVALMHLSKRLVIISARINGQWVADKEYADIEAPEEGIYNISRGGIYHSILYPEDPQHTIDELEPLAERIAACCPFAETFGAIGDGEGLVWKLVPYISDPQLWFKTKGGKFKSTFAPVPKKLAAGFEEKQEAAAAVARIWCSEQRMEQGWDYLREKGIERSMKGIGVFLKWVQRDILVEERGYIGDNGVDEGMLKAGIIAIAKPWYLARVNKGEK
ncbi:hypothetical protein BU26DRAFT_517586 [Trematosphaeria pertusa]|uniref:RNA ligase domain-containing protein n=1 Tax=Trematosphaeria pertusa TaxID=390896 RepID=A0A6A6ILW7_9PLEO|nr:uncharacterized protein BU26DRAFT_517586 [Trematosphaeria pertusa]KAF2250802.1 hypothetical protein BU26DRAFT_517586 [Trematosphaeria pertusa]